MNTQFDRTATAGCKQKIRRAAARRILCGGHKADRTASGHANSFLLGLELSADVAERVVDAGADVRDSADDGNADQSSDQAIFDSGCARLTLCEASEQFHNNSPNSRLELTNLVFGLPGRCGSDNAEYAGQKLLNT